MSDEQVRKRGEEAYTKDEGDDRDPFLTPDELDTAVGELQEEIFGEHAEQGLDQHGGPNPPIPAVIDEEKADEEK